MKMKNFLGRVAIQPGGIENFSWWDYKKGLVGLKISLMGLKILLFPDKPFKQF
jgi:hypothetical protein